MANEKPIRKRAGGQNKSASKVTSEMKKLAVQNHLASVEANTASRKAEKARKSLYTTMKAAGVVSFDHTFSSGGASMTVDAEIKTPVRDSIDTEVLKKLVDGPTFDKIVSATKGKVTEFAGTEVAKQCSTPTNGTENVSVKIRK